MKCREIQDYLITDYIDGEIEAGLKSKIDNHLQVCDSCSRFYLTIKRAALNPLTHAEEQAPDESVWLNIKDQIEAQAETQAQHEPELTWIEKLSGLFSPVQSFGLAVCSVILFLAVSIITVNQLGHKMAYTKEDSKTVAVIEYAQSNEAVEEAFEDSLEYLAYLDEDTSLEYGADIAEYFL